jgi:ribulose-5-phosphate 4-epimerase/fuculose-1-phosphate aldolase
MLNLQGTIGMFGHVSIRVPGTDKCFISPGASTEKSTVRPEQIFVYNIDGSIIEHPGGLIPLEWRIHTQRSELASERWVLGIGRHPSARPGRTA